MSKRQSWDSTSSLFDFKLRLFLSLPLSVQPAQWKATSCSEMWNAVVQGWELEKHEVTWISQIGHAWLGTLKPINMSLPNFYHL